jgi:hypothetical protein
MLYNPNKAATARRAALRRELNRPTVAKCTSIADMPAAYDAAVLAWFDKLCEFYEIDPAAPSRWEQLSMRLAIERFPKFEVVSQPPKVGSPGSGEAVMNLFRVFENYKPPRGSGSKYKMFLREHQAACAACNIETAGSLKEAMRRARQQRENDRRTEQLLVRDGMMKAFGLRN